MMKFPIFIFSIFLALSLSSCDEVLEPIEVEIPLTITLNGDVEIEETNDPTDGGFDQSPGGVDILNYPGVPDDIGTSEDIKSVRISSIKYEIKNFSGNVDANVNVTLRLFSDNENEDFVGPTINAAEADLLDNIYDLDGFESSIENAISNIGGFNYFIVTQSSHNPANFVVEMKVRIVITYETTLLE